MLLLLDIDGVMVQAASWKKVNHLEDGFFEFLPNAVNNLREILSETGASIVLTTSHKSSYSIIEWERIFATRGIQAKIEKLNDNVESLSRKDEILNWISQSKPALDFVIIDDDQSLHDLPRNIKDLVIFTKPLVGLTKDNAATAIDILKSVVLA